MRTRWSLVAIVAVPAPVGGGDGDGDGAATPANGDTATEAETDGQAVDVELPDSCENEQGITDDSITIAALTDLSGPIASIGGIDFGNAFKAHFDAVNADGGIDGRTVEVQLRDMKYDPVETTNQYEEIRTEVAMIPTILGSAAIDAVAADMEEDCLITFMGSPNGVLAQKYTSVFADTATYGHEVLNTVSWIIEDEGNTDATWAVAYQDDAFGQSLLGAAEYAAEQFGFDIATEVTFSATDQDVSAQVSDLVAAEADYVIFGGLPNQLPGFASGVDAAGSDMKFITTTGGWSPGILQTPAGDAIAEHVLVSTSFNVWSADDPGMEQLRSELEEYAPDVQPGQAALTGYTAALVTEHALREWVESGDTTLGGLYRATLGIDGYDSGGVIPTLSYNQFDEEARIPTHESIVWTPNADVVGGLEAETDYFSSDVSNSYVEPSG